MKCKLRRLRNYLKNKVKKHNTEWSWYRMNGHRFQELEHIDAGNYIYYVESCLDCPYVLEISDFDIKKEREE